MTTTSIASGWHSRYPLAALGKAVVAALAGVTLLLIYVQALIFGTFDLPLTICAIVSLVVACIIAIGWRWAPLLGSLWIVLATVLNAEGMRYDLTHPEQIHSFAWQVSMDVLLVGGVVAGITATMQNYRSHTGDRGRPRWLPYAMTALIALAIGAIVSAAIPRSEAMAGIDAKALDSLPPWQHSSTRSTSPKCTRGSVVWSHYGSITSTVLTINSTSTRSTSTRLCQRGSVLSHSSPTHGWADIPSTAVSPAIAPPTWSAR